MGSPPPYRIIMLEDSRSVQQLVRSILDGLDEFRLENIYDSVEAALADPALDPPHVFIVDINLPGRSGLDFIPEARERWPSAQLMVYTVHDDDDKVFQALMSGANGYLLKSASPKALVEGLHEMMEGGSPMSASVARRVIEHMRPTGGRVDPRQMDMLTDRENDVLHLLAQGMIYKEIADQLELSSFTVKNHIRNIYAKLQVRTRVEAVNRYFGR